MQLLLEQNKEYEKYATYNWQTGTVEINADEIAKIVSQEEGKKVEEFIQKLESFRDGINDAAGTLLDIKASVEKIEKEGQDARLTLEDNVL